MLDVWCRYRTARGQMVDALRGCTLDVPQDECVAVVGPSGSGKSTLVKALARLIPISSGRLTFPALNGVKSTERIAVLFQGSSHFPWRSVARNLSFRLELTGCSRANRQKRARELCQLVGLDPKAFLNRYPAELSGGQMRRVELAMTFSIPPQLWLLDEPTTGLDFVVRQDIQELIESFISQAGLTTLLVTHDVSEAVRLADTVVVMNHGRICGEVRIDLPRPRTQGNDAKIEQRCVDLVRTVVDLLRRGEEVST